MAHNKLGDKPGSRILHPPGGASSNIFGNDVADVTHRKQSKNHMQSTIFSPEPTSPRSQKRTARFTATEDTQEKLFGGEPEVATVALHGVAQNGRQEASESGDKKSHLGRTGFNPITGEPYGGRDASDDSKQAEKKDEKSQVSAAAPVTCPQSRARQPPGGASSKLW